MQLPISELLTAYQLPAVFLGAFFFGETVIITAAFLAGQGVYAVISVFWLAWAGTLASDSLWFLLGQRVFTAAHRWERYRARYAQLLVRLEQITGRRPLLALLFIKFLYGTRILTILYLSSRKMGFATFTLFNAIGTALWLAAMVSIGWLAGKGLTQISTIFQRIEYLFTALAVLLILSRVISLWLSRRILEK